MQTLAKNGNDCYAKQRFGHVILELAGIQAIPQERIDAYKEKEIRKHPPHIVWTLANRIGKNKLENLMTIGLPSSMMTCVGFGCASGNVLQTDGALAALYGFIAVLAFSITCIICAINKKTFKGPASWRVQTLTARDIDLLPAIARVLARYFKTVMPDATLKLEVFMQDEVILDDPILYIDEVPFYVFKGDESIHV